MTAKVKSGYIPIHNW